MAFSTSAQCRRWTPCSAFVYSCLVLIAPPCHATQSRSADELLEPPHIVVDEEVGIRGCDAQVDGIARKYLQTDTARVDQAQDQTGERRFPGTWSPMITRCRHGCGHLRMCEGVTDPRDKQDEVFQRRR